MLEPLRNQDLHHRSEQVSQHKDGELRQALDQQRAVQKDWSDQQLRKHDTVQKISETDGAKLDADPDGKNQKGSQGKSKRQNSRSAAKSSTKNPPTNPQPKPLEGGHMLDRWA
jgi:hypothetical protein